MQLYGSYRTVSSNGAVSKVGTSPAATGTEA